MEVKRTPKLVSDLSSSSASRKHTNRQAATRTSLKVGYPLLRFACHTLNTVRMLSCGGGGLSSFSSPRGFQTFAESELVFCRPAVSAAAGGEERSAIRSKTSRSSTMAFSTRPGCVDHNACSIASRRRELPCWPGRPVRPSMQLLDAKAFPARFVRPRPMPDWRWRTAMANILCHCPIRSGSRLSQKVSFPAVRRPRLATKEFRPLIQSIKLVDTVMASPHSRCVCPPNTMNS